MRRIALPLVAALIAVAVATAAFAQEAQKNTYSVKGALAPTGKSSKAKPLPVSVTFAYSVGEEHGLQPAAVKRYTIGFAGVRVNGQYFNTCQAGAISAAGNDDSSCPKSSLVGKGTIDNYVYADSDPSAVPASRARSR
jgi:hypothetical protein